MITLEKGGRVALNKSVNLYKVGLGWDASQTPGKEFDLDVLAIELNKDGKILTEKHLVFYNNLSDPEGAVKHSGDNRTGAGDGDDETIIIDLSKINANCESVVIVLNIHDAINRGQNFGQVKNAVAHLYEGDSTTPTHKYDLEEESSMSTQVRFVRIYRHEDGWKFHALGEQKKATLHDALAEYGIDATPNI